MKKIIFLLILFLSTGLVTKAQSPSFQWAKNIGSQASENTIKTALDASGNIYSTGRFQGTVDFDPGNGVSNLTSAGNTDIYICKLGPSGNFIWAKCVGGPAADGGLDISIDLVGNVYITGIFYSTADFDPGPGSYTMTSAGDNDAFILKLSNFGNFISAIQFGNAGFDYGNSIKVKDNKVISIGQFTGIVDLDPSAGVYNLSSSYGLYISNLDTSLNFVWAKQIDGTARGCGIDIDFQNNVLISGDFSDTLDFDPGVGTFTLSNNTITYLDAFILKLNSFGNFIWVKKINSTGYTQASAIAADGLGNVCVSGFFAGTVDIDPGPGTYTMPSSYWGNSRNTFVLKLDPFGNFLWGTNIDGSFLLSYAPALTIDPLNNIYVTGDFHSTGDFDPGPNVFTLTASGADVFIWKLSSVGNLVWALNIGSNYSQAGTDIEIDATGNIYTSGWFTWTCDFDPGPGIYNLTATGPNIIDSADVFVLKLNNSVITSESNLNGLRNNVNIYPNPANGKEQIIISYKGIEQKSLSINVSDILGKQVDFELIVQDGNSSSLKINNGSGIYFVNIKNSNGNLTKKIILQN